MTVSNRTNDHFISFGLELSSSREIIADPIISPKDRQVLRRLASHVAELAGRPIEQEKRALWYRHNALEPARPLILCYPENSWHEIITPDQFECMGELARRWEMALRREIFSGVEMCDDRVIEPYFIVPHIYTETDWGHARDQDRRPGRWGLYLGRSSEKLR